MSNYNSDLEAELLLAVLPDKISSMISEICKPSELIEIIMDLGRIPEVRFTSGIAFIGEEPVSGDDISYTISRIGDFGEDNRAGIEKTLHRISAIRNRLGKIIGLTCRVGRAVSGTIDIVRDLLDAEGGILIMGPPGVGKTTMLREMARILAETKRVVIVDTSNEIAGDGDIPHPGIGRARRMQVPCPDKQHSVMIEAVENHMPEVVVIDEIGVLEESYAARTIAERGVRLIATAHGSSLENLIQNPTLSELVGGIESVTLSDEEAKKRKTQKTVLERKAAPAFEFLIEIKNRSRIVLHKDLALSVDMLLRGFSPHSEERVKTDSGQIEFFESKPSEVQKNTYSEDSFPVVHPSDFRGRENVRIYPYGISRDRLEKAISGLSSSAVIARRPDEADLVLALKSRCRRNGSKISIIKDRNIPVFTVRANTIAQIEFFIADNLM